MKEKFESFCKALKKLKDALQSEPTELNRDATIQRFEFTYELAWKIMKAVLFKQGIECFTPRDCIKAVFQAKYIKDEEAWITMIKDRNLTAHIYDEDQALKIYHRIKSQHIQQFESLKKEFEGRI